MFGCWLIVGLSLVDVVVGWCVPLLAFYCVVLLVNVNMCWLLLVVGSCYLLIVVG